MIKNSRRTAYCAQIQQAMLMSIPYEPLVNTTINEKLTTVTQPAPTAIENRYPTMSFMKIGLGPVLDSTTGFGFKTSAHGPLDASLFKPLPFVIRPEDNDLSDSEKLNYRLRVKETISNNNYVCYYGKIIDRTTVTQNISRVTYSNNAGIITPLNTDVDTFLNPSPNSVSGSIFNNILESNDYIFTRLKLKLILTAYDVKEIKDACAIKYPGSELSIITELALCTGIDYDTGTNYIETAKAQIAYHIGISLDINTELAKEGNIVKNIEFGSSEPCIL